MLQVIREKLTGWFAWFILGAIALTLVVTFGNIDTGFTPAGTAFTVNGEDVPISEFRATYQQQRQQWESNFRAQLPPELAENMARSVIDQLVRNRALAQHVQSQGYRVSDADLVAAIQSNQAFHVGGRFSQPAYEQLLNSQGFTPQRFEYEERRTLEMRQYAEGIAYSSFYTPAEFRRYIALDGESRDVEFMLIPASQWVDRISISEDAIAERYAMDPSLYQSVESVALEYVVVNYADLLAEAEVSDSELREYFDQNQQEFRGPDDRQVSHILIAFGDDEAAAAQQAQQVSEELAAGASFESLAAKYSADTASASKGGSLGWLGTGDAPAQEFENAMLALVNKGDVSPPVRTEFGFHLIRLDDVRESARIDFADVADELRQRLREEQAADRYDELLDELDEQALESLDGLAPVAESMGLPLQSVDMFTRNGGGDLGFSPELVDSAFSLEVMDDGENSPVIMLDDGRAVVLRVTEHRPSVVRPLEEVRDDIRNVLLQEAAIAKGAEVSADLLNRLNAGAPADTIAAEVGQSFTAVSGMRRGDDAMPPELAAEVFRAPKPVAGETVYVNKLLASGDYALFRVTAAIPGRPDNFSLEDRDTRKQQLAIQLGGGQANAIVESLIGDAQVVVTPDLIENELGIGL